MFHIRALRNIRQAINNDVAKMIASSQQSSGLRQFDDAWCLNQGHTKTRTNPEYAGQGRNSPAGSYQYLSDTPRDTLAASQMTD